MQGRRSARARQGEVNEVAGLGVVPHAGAEGSGDWLRWVARVWAEIAIVGYLLWEATTPAPVRGEGDYWQRLAALVILALIVVGHLITWRWEIQGATVMAVAGALLAVVTSFRFEGWSETLLVLVGFTVPAVIYWWMWRRDRHHMRVVALAVLLTVLVAGSIGMAAMAQRVAYGPSHPQSTLTALPEAPVVWIWSGAPAATSAAVVARVRDPQAEVRLAVSTSADLADPSWFPASQRPADDPGVVRFDLTGLDPGTRYHYAAEVGGVLVAERSGQLRTIPHAAASFTFAFGNCARIGSNASSFDRIREAGPDLLLHLGDFAYMDFWTDDRAAVRGMYDTQLTTPAMDALVRSVPVAYMWDDHDFGPNDADSTAASGPAAQVVYRQAVPHPDLPAGDGPRGHLPVLHAGAGPLHPHRLPLGAESEVRPRRPGQDDVRRCPMDVAPRRVRCGRGRPGGSRPGHVGPVERRGPGRGRRLVRLHHRAPAPGRCDRPGAAWQTRCS